jgi:hypothetical protein
LEEAVDLPSDRLLMMMNQFNLKKTELTWFLCLILKVVYPASESLEFSIRRLRRFVDTSCLKVLISSTLITFFSKGLFH